jgi:iron complex outermembrane recepter protein
LLSINPVDAVIVPLPPQPNPGILTTPSTTRPDAVNNAFSFPSSITTQDHNLTFSMPVEDIVAVKNILGYHKVNVSSTDQLDGYGGLTLDPAGDTFQYLVTNTTSDQYAFSDELQTVTNMKWTTLTVGAIYAHNRTVEGSFNGLPNSIALQVVPRAADGSFVVPLVPGREPSIVAVTSVAVYLQNEAHLTDSLDLVLGGRFTNDKKTGIDNSPLPAPSVTIDYKKSTPTYLAGLNYKLTDQLFTYAKYSTAYITGGDLAGVAFAPTKARSWEAGLKSDLLDRTLRANLAVFAVNYDDLQTLTVPTNPACVAAGASQSASQCIVNGGNLRDVGFELETTYRPIRELTLQGNVSYSEAKYTKVNPNIASPDGRLYPQHLPRWTAHLSSQYDGPRLVQAAHPFARVDANFTASQYNEINDDAANTALMRAPATWITNLRMGLAGFQVGSGQLEVAAWAKNLLNDNSLTKSSNLFFVIDGQYQPARTYGIDVNVDF